MVEDRKVYRVWWKMLKERNHSKDQRHRWEDGIRMNLKEIGWGGGLSGSSWLIIGAGGGSCKYCDEPSDSGATDLVSQFCMEAVMV
jgi:hypothetical protein